PPPGGPGGRPGAEGCPGAAGGRVRDRAGERVPRRTGTTRTETGALGHQRGVRRGPPVVEAADDRVVTNARAVDEDLVEQCAAGHLAQRPDLDAPLLHVELEVRDALVLRQLGRGAREQHALVTELRGRRPHLLAGDDPLVTVLDRLRAEAREVGARARLGEQLAPRVLAVEDAQQALLLLT